MDIKKLIVFVVIIICVLIFAMLSKKSPAAKRKATKVNMKQSKEKNNKKSKHIGADIIESKKKTEFIDPKMKTILDTVAPISVEFNQNNFKFGDKIIRAYAITQYTPHPKFGWAADITGIPNTIVSMLYTPTSNADLMQALSRTLNVMRGSVETTKNYIEKQRTEQGIKNAEETIKRLDRTGESVGRYSCIILAYGTTQSEFQKTCSRVERQKMLLAYQIPLQTV